MKTAPLAQNLGVVLISWGGPMITMLRQDIDERNDTVFSLGDLSNSVPASEYAQGIPTF